MKGQIDFESYLQEIRIREEKPIKTCGDCICNSCLLHWSDRCPYGKCYDDNRAKDDPYDKSHPDNPPRKSWTRWAEPGEQEHWCRGGSFYPVRGCREFIKYWGQEIRECIGANVQVFQDGYICCSIVDTMGCEWCYERFKQKEF